jgi:hypothetical protein
MRENGSQRDDDVGLLIDDKDVKFPSRRQESKFKVEYLYIVLNLVSSIGIVVANKWVLSV